MKILAVEFSSERRSVAIVERVGDGVRVLGTANETGGRNSHPVALVELALAKTGAERDEIECIAVGLGPGSYTGVRAAIAFAQGWQLARQTKVLGISSVESVAKAEQENGRRGRIRIVVDAQRNEFYLAEYELGDERIREMGELQITGLTKLAECSSNEWFVTGPDAARFFPGAENSFPDAAALGKLASTRRDYVAGEFLQPIYLRETNFVKAAPARIIASR